MRQWVWIVMIFGMVLFWALVVVGIVWLVRQRPGRGRLRAQAEPTALDLLDRRLADGLISVEEDEERRRLLRGCRPNRGVS